TELEQFKNINKPVRKEFATTFVSWIPQPSVPSNAGTVLDLGNIIYKATWSDPNWDFTETDDEITLTRYKGTSNEIDLPAILDNKQVTLKDINNSIIPTTVTKFILKEKNGKKVKVQDNNLSQGFINNKNITEVDLSGLDSSSVTNLQELFKNCSNLLTATLTGMNTQNVSSFKSMFYECSKLTTVNVTGLNTASVTDMSYLFYNCFALKDIDLNGWNTTKVQWMGRMFHNTSVSSLDISHFRTPVLESTNRMFNGCNNLKTVRMDNFDMSHNTDSDAMFYRGRGTETLVVTNDVYLLNTHNFRQDNTHPLSKPVLNANGGKFDNQQNTKKYFDNCAVIPEKLQLAQFDQFKNSNIPTKDNAVFRGWTESGISKTDEGVLNLLDKTYTATWKNTICNTSPDNKKIESTGQLGMVYLPKQFATNSTTLKDSGKQEILVNKSSSLNIGIRDITQSRDSWSMTGQLKWNSSSIPGAYIQLDANNNSIKINQNDNVNPYDADRDLASANEEVMIGNSEEGHINLTSNSANIVMKANSEKTKDAIYDYNLGEVSLVIPDAGVVQDGNYSANLEWNLSNAPQ
ncbi:BspA family leucine-rich repeat surface protein, partial [Enterococcus faecium]|nr:BspA family leucine-rich repeat surface protein [Enterococcus faecium]